MTGNYSFRLNLGQIPPVAQGKDFNNLLPLHSAIHNLALQLDLYSGRFLEPAANYPQLGTSNINSLSQNKFYAQAGESIDPGDFVYFLASGTTVVAKRAIANSDTTLARGVYLGSTSLISGDWGEYILSSTLLTLASLTPGITYYLSATSPGDVTSTPPTLAQSVGWAISDTVLYVQLDVAGVSTGTARSIGLTAPLDSLIPSESVGTSNATGAATSATPPTVSLATLIPTQSVIATSP